MASSSTAAASTPSSSKAMPPPASTSDAEIDKLLSREASAFQRELEVERILSAFKLNPYDILDISEACTPEEIKKRYRHLSLFIHPDKTPHPRAPEAFDLLKKAESELQDKERRDILDAVIHQARISVLKGLQLPSSTPDDDTRLKNLDPPFKTRLKIESKALLIDDEVRRRKAIKMNLANEGREAQKKEEEVASKKRKAEDEKSWEANREQRVDSWRSFAKGPKKKKAKVQILG